VLCKNKNDCHLLTKDHNADETLFRQYPPPKSPTTGGGF
jgi:hypothetical protein